MDVFEAIDMMRPDGERRTPVLSVTREQAVRLFTESRVTNVELVNELAAWKFAGGIVLILDHTAEPPRFGLALEVPDV